MCLIALLISFIFSSCSSHGIKNDNSNKKVLAYNNGLYYEYIHYKHSIISWKLQEILFFRTLFAKFKNKIIKDKSNQKVEEPEFKLDKDLKKIYFFKEAVINDRKVIIISPKHNSREDKLVVYLHGGGYVANIYSFEWNLVKHLANKTGYTFIVPNYPLAPNHKAIETIDFIDKIVSFTKKIYPERSLVLMGTSAGGGLSLAYSMFSVKESPSNIPDKLILLSPWLDISNSNPRIPYYDKKDHMLSKEGLDYAAGLYKGELALNDYRVSPIFGDLTNLPPTTIFIGTHDMFYPDNEEFKDKLVNGKIKTFFYKYHKSFHVWMAVNILPEAIKARKQIVERLLD